MPSHSQDNKTHVMPFLVQHVPWLKLDPRPPIDEQETEPGSTLLQLLPSFQRKKKKKGKSKSKEPEVSPLILPSTFVSEDISCEDISNLFTEGSSALFPAPSSNQSNSKPKLTPSLLPSSTSFSSLSLSSSSCSSFPNPSPPTLPSLSP